MSQAEIETTETKSHVTHAAEEEKLNLISYDADAYLTDEEARWRKEVYEPIASKKASWKKDFTTVSGMDTNPMATPLSIADQDFREIAYPGEFPYTRGIHPTGYRGKLWTMRQFAGFGSAK